MKRLFATRTRMNWKRGGVTIEGRVGAHKLYVRVSEYEDGSPGEIFIDMSKEGSTLRSLLNCLAIAVSIGLQHGVPLSAFVRVFKGSSFDPCGATSDEGIPECTSVVDYVFRILEREYAGKLTADDCSREA